MVGIKDPLRDGIPAIKPQYVDRISQKVKGKVGEYIFKKDILNLS